MYQGLYEFSQSMWIIALLTLPLFLFISVPIIVIFHERVRSTQSSVLGITAIGVYLQSFYFFFSIESDVMLNKNRFVNGISDFFYIYIVEFSVYYYYLFCPLFFSFFLNRNNIHRKHVNVMLILNFLFGCSFFIVFYYFD
jgi:hypothetical protein